MIPKTFALPPELQANLTDLEGKQAQIKTEKNKELVVFWATWCPDCKDKIENHLPKINASKDVSVILVNTEKDIERVKKFVEKQQVKMPVVMDLDKKLRKELKISGVPGWAVYKRENKKAPWTLITKENAYDEKKVKEALN
ncbi:MAG: TlpA family protein disulfide reductase [Oligoflexia bacterium]|nr:TlpA family protein disulfide reductase [Oligoflexia bacterium]